MRRPSPDRWPRLCSFHEMIAGVDHLIPLPPALPLHEVPQPHQPGHLRDEQSLGQRSGDGLLIQHGDLLKPPGVTTVCHCLEGAVADVVALFA